MFCICFIIIPIGMYSSCDLLDENLTDEDRVMYLLNSVWMNELFGSMNDSVSYIAFQTLEFDSERFYLESTAAVYHTGFNPDTALSFRYMTGRISLQDIEFVNDTSAAGLISFFEAHIDTQFSRGDFSVIDTSKLNHSHTVFSVFFRKTDSLVVERYLDRNGILKTDTLYISGIGHLSLDAWYDSPQATHFTAFLYTQKK